MGVDCGDHGFVLESQSYCWYDFIITFVLFSPRKTAHVARISIRETCRSGTSRVKLHYEI